MIKGQEINPYFFELFDLIHAWINMPAFAMNLSENQQNFIRDQNVHICTAYIGMVRLYKDNRTIWQTSVSKVISDAIEKSFQPKDFCAKSETIETIETILRETKTHYQSLSLQCRDFLDKLMIMSDEERQIVYNTNLSLL